MSDTEVALYEFDEEEEDPLLVEEVQKALGIIDVATRAASVYDEGPHNREIADQMYYEMVMRLERKGLRAVRDGTKWVAVRVRVGIVWEI